LIVAEKARNSALARVYRHLPRAATPARHVGCRYMVEWRMARKAVEYSLVLALLACPALPEQGLVREEKSVVVDGATEVWRLVWKRAPRPACGPDDPGSFTCPCFGFAFGERGQLDLVRMRDGREIDRLHLTPLFGHDDFPFVPPEALVQRWERRDRDFVASDDDLRFTRRVRGRPVVSVMNLADYDHDGQSTEFFLQTGVLPCGKRMGVVIGLSPGNQRLHAFGSALHPGKPLDLQKEQWDALGSSAGPVRVIDWGCGDHGSETEGEVELQATSAGIRAVHREFECSPGRGKLLRKTQF